MRNVSGSALTSALPSPTDRGSYMAISGSLQQVAGGIASVSAGLILVQEPSGELLHFTVIGYALLPSELLVGAMRVIFELYVPEGMVQVYVPLSKLQVVWAAARPIGIRQVAASKPAANAHMRCAEHHQRPRHHSALQPASQPEGHRRYHSQPRAAEAE